MEMLTVGTRIYNRGDYCNHPHRGTIVAIRRDRWGTFATIAVDPEDNVDGRKPYKVPAIMVHDYDSGNGSTRIVTLQAYVERQDRMARVG
ncbi:MAG: hypothetical protein KO463_03515 [Candidatus Methanofastidiosa archaeon]|nr:hypothetical protein [Candidatus Methanofastidiosa archaeon]